MSKLRRKPVFVRPKVFGDFDTRFWLKVWPRGDCWEWRGHRVGKGYGITSDSKVFVWAHRYAYIVAKGPIIGRNVIDHLCNHPWCVKPSHLVQTTNRANILRGSCPSAINARKEFCIRGHLLPATRTSKRRCRDCDRIYIRA